MASIKEVAKGRSDVYLLQPSQLQIKEGWNGREPDHPDNIAHVDALAQSIAAEGVKEPLAVYVDGENIFIENGHMRHAAALLAIEKYGAPADLTVPVRTTPKDAKDEDRILSQIIRNSGKQLAPLEMAGVFERLNNLGLSDAEIGRRTGLSRVYIGQLIQLSKMPKGVTAPVRDGTVSATLAITTMKRFDGDGKKTASALKDAISFAKLSGKTKATAKHVKKAEAANGTAPAEKKTKTSTEEKGDERTARKSTFTVMAEVRTIIETSVINADEDKNIVRLTVPYDKYRELSALLDLTFRLPEVEREPDELV